MNPLIDEIEPDVMGFLNEIQIKYPESISFASGRPPQEFFNIDNNQKYIDLFVEYTSKRVGKSKSEITSQLGQYNVTKGIINDILCKFLLKDEGILVPEDSIITTVGAQEGMMLAVLSLCNREKDVIIQEDPSYIGLANFSKISGYQLDKVGLDSEGISIELLEQKITTLKTKGKKVKLVYVIPDYQNPTGVLMSQNRRVSLLEMAEKYDFYILEDNAYGDFYFNGSKLFPIKSIDVYNRVIYLRSFSKSLYPSIRVGALIANQKVKFKDKDYVLSDIIAKVKGYTTVNTSSISQAILGGMLIDNEFSFEHINKTKRQNINEKLSVLVKALNFYVSVIDRRIYWNEPKGGFFLNINVPFKVDQCDVEYCVSRYGLIITPMSFFFLSNGGENSIRLAFSNLSKSDIVEGIKKLAAFIKDKLVYQ